MASPGGRPGAPDTNARLGANVAANGLRERIRTLRTAAGDAVSEVGLFVAADSAFSSLKDTRRTRIRERIRVPCTTLDALAAEQPLPIGLLKIDVEGLERAVIAGAAELLRRDRPVLLVEIYGGVDSNPDPEGTVEDIRAHGYEPFVYAFRPHDDLIVVNAVVPEAAIALPQEGWDQAVSDAGLEQVGDVLWGNWCGRTPFTSYQDMVIVRKLG
jgi:FkbM family methyltransferase